MKYLEELMFSEEEIKQVMENNNSVIAQKIKKKSDLVRYNLLFLKDYGIKNYKEIFIKYTEIFLQEPSIFKNIFLKYKKDDLIEKLNNNVNLITLL